MKIQELSSQADAAEQLLRLLANRWRLMVLCELLDGELSVGELQVRLGLSQSALSQHLARLRSENLVATRREVNSIFYSVSSHEVRKVLALLHELYCRPKGARRRPTQPNGD